MAGPVQVAFRIVLIQKLNIPAIGYGGFRVVCLKGLKQFCRDLAGLYPFIDRQVPGMFAFFASVYQPYVNVFPVGVHPEFAGIHKFLLFPATSAAKVHFYPCMFRLIQRLLLRPVADS